MLRNKLPNVGLGDQVILWSLFIVSVSYQATLCQGADLIIGKKQLAADMTGSIFEINKVFAELAYKRAEVRRRFATLIIMIHIVSITEQQG
jgi:hypothetical protein